MDVKIFFQEIIIKTDGTCKKILTSIKEIQALPITNCYVKWR